MVPFEMGVQKTQATSSLRKNQCLSFQLERNGETEETIDRGQLNFGGEIDSGSMTNTFHTLSSGTAKRLQQSNLKTPQRFLLTPSEPDYGSQNRYRYSSSTKALRSTKLTTSSPISTPAETHKKTPKAMKTPKSSGTISSVSVYERLYANRKSPILPATSSSRKKSLNFTKSKEGEIRSKAKRLMKVLQEIKTHPLFLKNAPESISSLNGINGINLKPSSLKHAFNSEMGSSDVANGHHTQKDVRIAAAIQIQRIYRGFCVQTFIAIISVVYGIVIIQASFRRHMSRQHCQIRRIKRHLQESQKEERKPFLHRLLFRGTK